MQFAREVGQELAENGQNVRVTASLSSKVPQTNSVQTLSTVSVGILNSLPYGLVIGHRAICSRKFLSSDSFCYDGSLPASAYGNFVVGETGILRSMDFYADINYTVLQNCG